MPSRHEAVDAAWGERTTQPRVWTSGAWRLECRDDELADIRYRDRLVLRSVRGVARDRDWNTIPTTVQSFHAADDELRLVITLVGGDADLEARLVVRASGDELDVSWECRALAPFLRNRLGLVVLHPPQLAGESLVIEHAHGSRESTAYPMDVSPHQPALDIRALEWAHEGVSVRVDFAGDVFEMEDQRNWTDASYKTYSTPLDIPFPVLVTAEDIVTQSVHVRCRETAPAAPSVQDARIALVPTDRRVPQIGTSASTGPTFASQPLPGSPLLVEVPGHTAVWREVLERARAEAAARPLDVRIVAESPSDLPRVLDALVGANVARAGVFSATSHVSESDLWEAFTRGLGERGLDIALVGGARSHFTELNRTLQRLPNGIPSFSFSITPQMHATGREQLVESIAMQRIVAEQAVRMTGRPVHVGPITLRSRFNAVATTPQPDTAIEDLSQGYGAALLPEATDARQRSAALLAWTVASAAALSVDGVESLSYFEASGERGWREASGAEFPAATALTWLGELSGWPLWRTETTPDGVWALAAETPSGLVSLVANLGSTSAHVLVEAATARREVEVGALSAVRLELTR
jgi:hypothetical protein